MAETFEKLPAREPLVLNILDQDTYYALRDISSTALSTELSNQLFLTDGDALVPGEVDGLPGEVIYFTNEGMTHGPILVRNGYVCETEDDLSQTVRNAKPSSGTTKEVNLEWDGE